MITASMPQRFEASAPGSMMLMGEYAVLEGSRAVLMTLKHRLRVTLAASDKLRVLSDKFDPYAEGETPKPSHVVLCENVLSLFSDFYAETRRGLVSFALTISSDIPPTYGFASSAALVAALVKALHAAFGIQAPFCDMFRIGHQAILDTFQRGSGADLAAALADMPFLIFDPKTVSVMPFEMPFAVQAVYVGYKTPTPQVLAQVAETIPPPIFSKITKDMADCVDDFIVSPRLDLITMYQSYMDALGVTCDSCRLALDIFTHQGIAAKISGSGRGDCVVGFGMSKPLSGIKSPFVLFSQGELQQ